MLRGHAMDRSSSIYANTTMTVTSPVLRADKLYPECCGVHGKWTEPRKSLLQRAEIASMLNSLGVSYVVTAPHYLG